MKQIGIRSALGSWSPLSLNGSPQAMFDLPRPEMRLLVSGWSFWREVFLKLNYRLHMKGSRELHSLPNGKRSVLFTMAPALPWALGGLYTLLLRNDCEAPGGGDYYLHGQLKGRTSEIWGLSHSYCGFVSSVESEAHSACSIRFLTVCSPELTPYPVSQRDSFLCILLPA